MKTYLEYQDEKSHKFWEIEQKGKTNAIRYGKVGNDGRETSKTFDSEEEAQKDAEKLINTKKKKGYVKAISSTLPMPSKQPKAELKPVKIRQPLLENPAYDFEYEKNPPQNPEGIFMLFEEANEKYKIEGGQLEYFVTKAFVLDGDVHIKSEEEAQKIVAQAHKEEYSVLIIITGNLTYEDWLGAAFSPLMVCGDVRCDGVGAGDENDTTVKGNIYAKQAFWLSGSDCCFTCVGKVYTPYFLTDGNDINVSITLAKGYIGIEDNSEAYESEMGYKVHYKGKHYKTFFEYEVLDAGFELHGRRFVDYVASGKNPIREFERTKEEIKADKKRKETDIVAEKTKDADNILELNDLNLKAFPEEILKLTELGRLDISGNEIKKLPTEIKNLKNLTHLIVSHNQDINIDAVCELEKLKMLNIQYVAYNDFKLPDDFGKLKNLKTLLADVGSGKIINPQVITELENLQNLAIKVDYLWKGSPFYISGIKEMKNLKAIKITGNIPEHYKEELKKEYANFKVIFER